jgi:hypothetical protein
MIDIELMRSLLSYEPETGEFSWLCDRSNIKAGSIAGWINNKGYRLIRIGARCVPAHRIAWAMTFGEYPSKQIDHIDGDRSNNRLSNLRLATLMENCRNRKLGKRNKLGFKGIYRMKGSDVFVAHIRIGGSKMISLGSYDTPEEAAHAYNKAAVLHHGEFATLNPVGGVFEDSRRSHARRGKHAD